MVAGKDVCLRQLSKGDRAREVRFNRLLGNAKVTTERIIESWSDGTVISGGLFEASCDAAELLELGEAALHEMALGIEMLVERVFERA